MRHYAHECTKGMFGEPSVQGSSALRFGRVGRPPIAVRTVGVRIDLEESVDLRLLQGLLG